MTLNAHRITSSCVALGLLLALGRSPLLSAAPPSSVPATQPGRPSEASLVAQLDSADVAEREHAADSLMLLTAAELPKLRAAVEAMGPSKLSAGQVALLRDIVMHVFATGDHNFTADPSYAGGEDAKIGIRFPPGGDVCIVYARTLGMDSYRALRDGDRILAVLSPDAPPEPRPNDWTILNTASEFRELLPQRFKVGDLCTLRLVRDGRVIEVEVRLARIPKPPAKAVVGGIADENAITADRLARATQYWTTEFAVPLKLNP
jgi:hypothetical protein